MDTKKSTPFWGHPADPESRDHRRPTFFRRLLEQKKIFFRVFGDAPQPQKKRDDGIEIATDDVKELKNKLDDVQKRLKRTKDEKVVLDDERNDLRVKYCQSEHHSLMNIIWREASSHDRERENAADAARNAAFVVQDLAAKVGRLDGCKTIFDERGEHGLLGEEDYLQYVYFDDK